MLLSSRPTALKLISCATLLTFSAILFFNYHIGAIRDWRWATVKAAPSPAPATTSTQTQTQTPTPIPTLTLAPLPTSAEISVATAIPEKLWYKLGPKGLNDESRQWIETCLEQNPTYESELLTDLSGDTYVKEHFASRPDIIETYLALPIPILKADLLRYLLLFIEGGIWSDLDISCEGVPIHDWIPAQYKEAAGLVVGLEFDMGWGDNFVRQFASWTMMARPGLTHIFMVVEDILVGLREKTETHNVTIAGLTVDMIGDVVDLTGPRRLTRSVLKSLELTLQDTVDHRNFSELLEPKLIGDVLILPGYSFANSSNTYDEPRGPVLVTHHYAGTWKNENGGELP